MKKYEFDISWQARVRGYTTRVVEAETEEKAREILDCTIEIDYNENSRSDLEWDIEGVTKL